MPMQTSAGITDIKPQQNAAKNVEGILDFNSLQYEVYPDLSVVVDRTYKDSFFQKNEFKSGETAYCILNSGSDYIHARNSYLSFDVTGSHPTSFPVPNWNSCDSAYNLISSIRITDRAGNEIEYVIDADIIAAIRLKTETEPDYLETIGASLFGYNAGASPITDSAATRFVIPLRWISGLFDYDQLLPAQLCSGLRIQIVFNSVAKMARWGTDPGTTTEVTMSNCRIVLDSHKLTDSVTRQLNLRSANDGLEIQFRTWFTQQFTPSSSTVSLENRRAVSRAFCAWLHHQDVGSGDSHENHWDVSSVTTGAWNFTEWQWRAGNLYFPQQPVKGTAAESKVETMQRLYSKTGKLDTPVRTGGVLPANYSTSYGNDSFALIPVDLERSTVLDVSGLPLNNSRVLAFNGTFGSSTSRRCRVLMQYLKIARVFMDNTELEE